MLIPIDLFLFSVPAWCQIVILILGIGGFVYYIVTAGKETKLLKKILLGCLEGVIVFIGMIGVYGNPYWNSISFRSNYEHRSKDANVLLTYEEAKEDLDYMMKYLVKDHPIFIDGATEELTRSYNQALDTLQKAEKITVVSLWREMERVVAPLRNAHTETFYYSETMHYLKYAMQHRDSGDRLVAINGISLEEWFEKNKALLSYELDSWGIAKIKSLSSYREGLDYLEINPDNVVYTYENKNGDLVDSTYYDEDFVLKEEYEQFNQSEGITAKEQDFVHYEIDQDNHIGILTLSACIYNDTYKNIVRDFFRQVKNNSIKNIIVDLRSNGGGNSIVANEFIRYLGVDEIKTDKKQWRMGPVMWKLTDGKASINPVDNLKFDGNVYMLTSVNSFSSAMLFAEYITDNGLGKIVGEIPGNAPNSYGDISIFETPNAKLYFTVSTKKFERADSSKKENYIAPDFECDARDALNVSYDLILKK